MRKSTRFVLTAMVAAVAFATLIASASADRLSISTKNIRVIWRSLIFENTGRTARVLCPVTLEGTLHSATIVKTLGSLIGFITRASIKGGSSECTGGTATILSASLPWHLTYQGYSGLLPLFELLILLLVGPAFQVHPNGSLNCLARSEVRHPLQGNAVVERGGMITGLRAERGKSVPLTGEGGLCAFGGEGVFAEEEVASVTNETGSLVTVKLI